MKICRKCEQPYDTKYCKPCHYKACRSWEERNREKANALRKKWKAENRDKVLEKDRKSAAKRRATRPDEVRAAAREWYAANPDKVKAWKRGYYEANADACRDYTRAWIAANRDKAATTKHNRRLRVQAANGTHTAAEWSAILKKHGGKCARCGSRKDLTRDHVVPISQGGTNFAYNLQPLCRSCNSSKREFWAPESVPSLFDRP